MDEMKHAKWVFTKKHLWYRDKAGEIDEWRLDIGFHNGPECQICGEAFCEHCHKDWADKECSIGHYECSACGEVSRDGHERFCPGCGARMDGEETPHMMAFDPVKWGDTELERWNGVVTAMRVKMHQYMGCAGTTRCPEECRYKHLCAWTRDVQIMCGKELNRRRGERK